MDTLARGNEMDLDADDCDGIDLISFVPGVELGSECEASDMWGWTDGETGDEIALVCFADTTTCDSVWSGSCAHWSITETAHGDY